MNSVIKQIKRCFTIYTALFITLITSRFARALHACDQSHLVECAKPLSSLTESGMTFVSNRTDLERICPDLKGALSCIHKYTRTCMRMHHRKHFNKLFHGTSTKVRDLCDNPTYQEEYLKYVPCMIQVADRNQMCFDRYSAAMKEIQRSPRDDAAAAEAAEEEVPTVDMVEYQRKKKRQIADEGIKNVCCTFQEYMQCSTQVTERACGAPAAEFSRNFLDQMSSAMIKMHCSEFTAQHCGLSSAAASTSYGNTSTASVFALTGTLLAVIVASLRHTLVS